MAYICFVDEAGCPGALPTSTSNVQPVLAIVGLVLRATDIPSLTTTFLKIKRKYYPGLMTSPHLLDDLLVEIKGSEVRSQIRKFGSGAKRQLKFLDETLDLLRAMDARLFSVCWLKGAGKRFAGRPVYTRSIQVLCEAFEEFLRQRSQSGFVVADFREPKQNAAVAHSVFTQRFRAVGDRYPHLLELPVFGHSQNHVALQITDLLCSTLIFPAVAHVYCTGYVNNIHVHVGDAYIKRRFMSRLKRLQFRFAVGTAMKGGIVIFDAHAHRPTSLLFR